MNNVRLYNTIQYVIIHIKYLIKFNLHKTHFYKNVVH